MIIALDESTAALNLMLCYYAISDREKLKKTFQRSLQISTGIEDEDRYYPTVVSPRSIHMSHVMTCMHM